MESRKTGSKSDHFGGMSQMILGPFLESDWFVSPNGKSKKGIKKWDFQDLGPFWESKLLVSPNGKSRIGVKKWGLVYDDVMPRLRRHTPRGCNLVMDPVLTRKRGFGH